MDYSEFYREWRDEALKSYTRVMSSTVESPAFIEAMGASTEHLLSAQKQVRKVQTDMLGALDVPTRSALAGLARQVQMAEKRALETEDRAEAVLTTQARLAQQLESLTDTLQASDVRGKALEARLQQLQQK